MVMHMRYRIASFNMKNWGKNPSRDFEKISDIIVEEDLDIVAFQEIWSEGAGVKRLLQEDVKHQLYNWDLHWAVPRETRDLTKIAETISRRSEGYAYIWNARKFKLTETTTLQGAIRKYEPRIVQRHASSFVRAPYYIRLQPLYGGFFDLRLLNIHIYHGGSSTWSNIEKRKQEYATLVKEIYPEVSQRRYGDFRPAYTIAMGDYNLNIIRPNITDLPDDKGAFLNVDEEIISIPQYGIVQTFQDQKTTLKSKENGYANNFDHFTYSPDHSSFSDVSFQVIDAVEKYCDGDFSYYLKNISDHLPIVMEIEL